MVKLKLQYFGHLMQRVDSVEKTLVREWLRVRGEVGSYHLVYINLRNL